MKTSIRQPQALEAFKIAEQRYREERQAYEKKAEALRQQEEEAINALPWYSRMWAANNFLTGFKEDIRAIRAKDAERYCKKQIRILQTLSLVSRVCLCQKDLEILQQQSV